LVPEFRLSNLFAKAFELQKLFGEAASNFQERLIPCAAIMAISSAGIHSPANAFSTKLIGAPI
jgi:hypothetical protein